MYAHMNLNFSLVGVTASLVGSAHLKVASDKRAG